MEPIDPNHLRRLAGLPLNESADENLEESITNDPAINDLITQNLSNLDPAEQTKYLDALETLQNAGRAGLTGQEWMAAYRQLRPTDPDAKDILPACARLFMGHTLRKEGQKYIWDIDSVAYADDEENFPDPLKQAVGAHVDLAYELLAYAREVGEVSIRSLSRTIMNKTGMVDPTMCQQMALNFLDANRGNFRNLGDGNYAYEDGDRRMGPRGTTNYSDMFKDMANKAGQANLGDD